MAQMQSFPTDVSETRMVEPKVEAAGIEPACDSPPNPPLSRGNLSVEAIEPNRRGFSAAVDLGICGSLVVSHGFLTWYARPGAFNDAWAIPLDEAIPKLEFLLKTARLAQEM